MLRCIQLAKNGLGTTYPNPLVGSVIVLENKIIAEGWHYKSGAPHAEVNAIRRVKNKEDLKKATLYVNLEPCSHFGRTPPCADLIIENKIPRVVIGNLDPNPLVAGAGVARLREAGCEVIVGVCDDACNDLNKRFFTFHRNKRPYILLKWAQTKDGFLAPESRPSQAPVWISNDYSRQQSHKLRTEEAAILIGTNTAMNDNPKLTPRDWFGRAPLRIVLDRDLKLSRALHFMDGTISTLVFTEKKSVIDNSIQYVQMDFKKELSKQICEALYERQIQSVIVEGGAKTLQTFIDESLWDEAIIFEGSNQFSKGIKAPIIKNSTSTSTNCGNDLVHHFKNIAL